MNDIRQRVEQFKEDRRHGASQLLSVALAILIDAARELPANAEQPLIAQLNSIAEEMADLHPSMINIGNALRLYKQILMHIDKSQTTGVIREKARERALALQSYCLDVSNKVVANAVQLINEGNVLMTCSFSSTVSKTFKQAYNNGKHFSVLVLQSCWKGCCYGSYMHQELQAAGIESSLIGDQETTVYLPQTDMIFLGCDTLFYDGTLVNGFPSRELALAAASNRPPVPVIALLDSLKIYHDKEGEPIHEGFQAVPFESLHAVVSEEGVHRQLAEIQALSGPHREKQLL